MNAFIIRDYLPSDYQSVIRVWSETSLGGAERGDNAETIEKSIALGGRLLLLIEEASEDLAGTSWMTFDGRRIHLHHFGIAPAFQGRGLSKQLLKESLKHVKRSGHQVKIEVHQSNTIALNLYKGMGFKNLGAYDIYIIRDVEGIEEA